jgi:hypothetical protein
VSDKDADAKNYQKCCDSLEHTRSLKVGSSKQLRRLHSQSDSLVAPTISAGLMIPSNGRPIPEIHDLEIRHPRSA